MILNGDCLFLLPTLDENSVDACVTDPPYGLSFMGKDWDHGVPGEAFWREVYRVLKPGAHLVAFGGTRTYHRLTCAIEDAGFEIRDCLGWLYGSGFPKSHNIGNGFGTALKPAWEPIVLARKPLVGTVAANVQQYGTGAMNIDGCRVVGPVGANWQNTVGKGAGRETANANGSAYGNGLGGVVAEPHALGRWPANICHDGSEEVLAVFPDLGKCGVAGTAGRHGFGTAYVAGGHKEGTQLAPQTFGDSGSAARFFYCAKASKSDRGDNTHPTVKPTKLMRWLCRLVTPPGGTILDPFMGSGSTGKAALQEGFEFVGIELQPEYCAIAEKRMSEIQPELKIA